MIALLMSCLIATLLFVGLRLAQSRAENAQLRTLIASLKRQLARRDH